MSKPSRDEIIKALRTVFDPELPVNIYDLGLIYDIDVRDDGHVAMRMTLTSPNCPVAELLPQQVKAKALEVAGVASADVSIVFEPPWSMELMSEAARFELELMGLDPSRMHGSRLTNITVGRSGKKNA
jgi:FeS assembly SUF system protein